MKTRCCYLSANQRRLGITALHWTTLSSELDSRLTCVENTLNSRQSCDTMTVHRGVVFSIPASYSGCPWFVSQTGGGRNWAKVFRCLFPFLYVSKCWDSSSSTSFKIHIRMWHYTTLIFDKASSNKIRNKFYTPEDLIRETNNKKNNSKS
jgi:hypothetical protein